MRVELNLPDKVWAECLDVAEQNYTTVGRVIEAAIKDMLRPSMVTQLQAQARHNHVLRLWGEGLTDAVIAERTGELRQYVAAARRKAGLPANQMSRASGTTKGRAA